MQKKVQWVSSLDEWVGALDWSRLKSGRCACVGCQRLDENL